MISQRRVKRGGPPRALRRLLTVLIGVASVVGPCGPPPAEATDPPPAGVLVLDVDADGHGVFVLPYDITVSHAWASSSVFRDGDPARPDFYFNPAIPRDQLEAVDFNSLYSAEVDSVDIYVIKAGTVVRVGEVLPRLTPFGPRKGGNTEIIVSRSSLTDGSVVRLNQQPIALPKASGDGGAASRSYVETVRALLAAAPDSVDYQRELQWHDLALSIKAKRLTYDPVAVEDTARVYGSVPGGIVLEGAATVDGAAPTSLTYSGGGVFVVDGDATFDSGLTDEEVALLAEFVMHSSDTAHFGAVSQEQAVGVPADSVVSKWLTVADGSLGRYVYGYDVAPELWQPPESFTDYTNPTLTLLTEAGVGDIDSIKRQVVSLLYGIEPRVYLRFGDTQFARSGSSLVPVDSDVTVEFAVFSAGADPSEPVIEDDPTLTQPEYFAAAGWVSDHLPQVVADSPALLHVSAYSNVLGLLRAAHSHGVALADDANILDTALSGRSHDLLVQDLYTSSGVGYRSSALTALTNLESALAHGARDELTPYGEALVQIELANLAASAGQPKALAYYRLTALAAIVASNAADASDDIAPAFDDAATKGISGLVVTDVSNAAGQGNRLLQSGSIEQAAEVLRTAEKRCGELPPDLSSDDPHLTTCTHVTDQLADVERQLAAATSAGIGKVEPSASNTTLPDVGVVDSPIGTATADTSFQAASLSENNQAEHEDPEVVVAIVVAGGIVVLLAGIGWAVVGRRRPKAIVLGAPQ